MDSNLYYLTQQSPELLSSQKKQEIYDSARIRIWSVWALAYSKYVCISNAKLISLLWLFLAWSLAILLLALCVSLGVLSLLRVIIPGVAFDQCEGFLLDIWSGGKRHSSDLSLEGNTPKILLFIMFSYWKLIISNVVTSQCAISWRQSLFELLEFLLEGLLKVCHYLGPLSL